MIEMEHWKYTYSTYNIYENILMIILITTIKYEQINQVSALDNPEEIDIP